MKMSDVPSFLGKLHIKPAPDAIIEINSWFNQDSRSNKINAGIGVLVGEDGTIWTPPAVKKAARNVSLLQDGGYVVPEGQGEWGGKINYLTPVAKIIFGKNADRLLSQKQLAAVGTVGGTHALSTFAQAVKQGRFTSADKPVVLLADYSYPNHDFIFSFQDIPILKYPHLTSEGLYNFSSHLDAVKKAPPGTILVFQGTPYNPAGLNANTPDQWRKLAAAAKSNSCRAFFDLAY